MTIKDVRTRTAYTKEQADNYDVKRFATVGGMCIHEMELEILRWALNYIPKNSNILEVGCGTGRFIVETSFMGYKVDGLDASPTMLEKLKEKTKNLGNLISLRVGEAAELPYNNNSYDFVYSIRLLNQTESVRYALNTVAEMLRVTKPRGFALVEFVNARRPRIGRNKTKTTRLTCKQIIEIAIENKSMVVDVKGGFFFGMGAIDKFGERKVRVISWLDRKMARLFPKYCSRIYVLLKKEH